MTNVDPAMEPVVTEMVPCPRAVILKMVPCSAACPCTEKYFEYYLQKFANFMFSLNQCIEFELLMAFGRQSAKYKVQ